MLTGVLQEVVHQRSIYLVGQNDPNCNMTIQYIQALMIAETWYHSNYQHYFLKAKLDEIQNINKRI